jgi:outer membrane protein assembly factor BamB
MKNQWVAITAWFGVIMGSTFSAFAGESVSFQINPQHTGAAIFDGELKLPLQQLWTRNMHGLVTYPLIAEGNVFVSVGNVGTYGSVFYALNEKTGGTIWSESIPGTYFTSLAAYDGGNVFVLNFDGVLRAFQALTGTPLWQVQVPGQSDFSSPPTARDGVIYINAAGSGATLYAIREKDGSIAWSQGTNGSIWGAPTLSEDGVFVSYPCQALKDSHGLVARGIPGFGVKWSFAGDNTISPAAIVVNGHVIVASNPPLRA